ncbi:MAG TPA: Gfo/Idh/MocA family oxidoreductase [Steroidobacteraceae bacterium]|jgi:predicted dehydrogenase|nr:Gfo/Idh/MocA family oxidoreductase [Steroidobacteraceae bacterium]
MIRIGILGAARIAPRGIVTPANALLGAEVVAIAARNLERAQDFAAQHAIPMAFGSYAELVARDDIDLVYVALPPSAHLQWCTAALANGKHVLVEKPFANNAHDAAKMVAAAQAAGRQLIEGFHYRYHPLFEQALTALRNGEIGRIRHIEAVFNAALPDTPGELRYIEALGGGALMDLGCYCMHWIRTVAGDEPTVVSANARCSTPGVDLDIEAELAFTSGPTATLKCSMQPPDGVLFRRLRVRGEDGVLELDNPVSPHAGATLSVESANASMPQIVSDGDTTFHYQLRHIIEVIEGRAKPLTGGEDAIGNMRAIDAIYRAAGLRPRGMSA